MGLIASSLTSLGLPGMQSFSIDRFYNMYFHDKITTFDEFHIQFLKLYSDANSIFPGKRFVAPPMESIKGCYNDLKDKTDAEKKTIIKDFLKKNVGSSEINRSVLMTGLVAPPASMFMKRQGENLPAVKKLRLNLVPDIVFVPSCTLLAMVAVKAFQIGGTSKANRTQQG